MEVVAPHYIWTRCSVDLMIQETVPYPRACAALSDRLSPSWYILSRDQQRLIGAVKVKNGLYRVDHENEHKAMVASTKEVLTIVELHRRMSHISPDAPRRLVKDGVVEG